MTAAGRTVGGPGSSGVPARRPKPAGRVRELLTNERLIYGAAGVVLFLIIWEYASNNGLINARWFPAPTLIVQAGLEEIQTEQFYASIAKSFNVFFWGFSLAVIIGIPLGLATGWFKRLNYALDPWINFFNALPRVALLPILVIMFGVLGPEATIAVVFLGAFISILIVTVMGVRTVDRRYLDVANSFNASQRRIFTSVVALATVPFIITGLRIGMARALIGVVTGELYAWSRDGGLGSQIKVSSLALDIDRMLFFVFIFTVTGITGVQIIKAIERRFQKWRPEQES
jgi:NitT/TauT family transport system permease protein